MKISPTLCALIGAILYGVGNPIIEKKLSSLNPFSLILYEYSVILALAIICQLYFRFASSSSSINFDVSISTWGWIIFSSLLAFGAGMFYLTAFTSGGDAITISLMLLMSPVATAVVSAICTRKLPTAWHIAGYIFAALAVFCILKSNAK